MKKTITMILCGLLLVGAVALVFSCKKDKEGYRHDSPECEELSKQALKALQDGDLDAYLKLTGYTDEQREQMVTSYEDKFMKSIKEKGGIDSYKVLSSTISHEYTYDDNGAVTKDTKKCQCGSTITYGNGDTEPYDLDFHWDETSEKWLLEAKKDPNWNGGNSENAE